MEEEEEEEEIPFSEIPTELTGSIEEKLETQLVMRTKKTSLPVLGKLEVSRIISERAWKLAQGEKPFIKTRNMSLDQIAKMELMSGHLNGYMKVKRIFTDGTYETWELSEFKYIYSQDFRE